MVLRGSLAIKQPRDLLHACRRDAGGRCGLPRRQPRAQRDNHRLGGRFGQGRRRILCGARRLVGVPAALASCILA